MPGLSGRHAVASICAAGRSRWSASWRARGCSSSRRASGTWPPPGPTRPARRTGACPTRSKAAMGIGAGLVRVSVGLEDAAELMADLDEALGDERGRGGAASSVVTPVTLEAAASGSSRSSRSHAAGVLAAALGPRGTPTASRWCPGPRPRPPPTSTAALAEQEAGRALPFATVDRARGVVVGCTRFCNIEFWPWPAGNRQPARDGPARRGGDRLDLAGRRRAADADQHRGEAVDAGPRVRSTGASIA